MSTGTVNRAATAASPRVRPAAASVRRRCSVPELESDEALVARYQRTGNRLAAEELVRRYLPLAKKLARRYSGRGVPDEDLAQVACAALFAAASRFDCGRGSSLRSFAIPSMLGELRRHFRDSGWSLHVTRSLQERALATRHAIDRLSARNRASPTVSEIAEEIGSSREEAVEALMVDRAYQAEALDALGRSDDGAAAPWPEPLAYDEAGFGRVEQTAGLARALRALPARERTIVLLRFERGLSQPEIGATLGVSHMHVSRLLRRALERMEIVLAPHVATAFERAEPATARSARSIGNNGLVDLTESLDCA